MKRWRKNARRINMETEAKHSGRANKYTFELPPTLHQLGVKLLAGLTALNQATAERYKKSKEA